MTLNIRSHLIRTGMTQDALSEKVGISKGYMSELASGKKQPSHSVLLKIAETLKIPVAALVATASGTDRQSDDLPNIPGFAEPGVVQWQGKGSREVKDIFKIHSIKARHPVIYRTVLDLPAFAITAGDLVLCDMSTTPNDGDIVVATIADTSSDTQHTTLLRTAPPWFMPGAQGQPPILSSATNSIGIMARVLAIIRFAK